GQSRINDRLTRLRTDQLQIWAPRTPEGSRARSSLRAWLRDPAASRHHPEGKKSIRWHARPHPVSCWRLHELESQVDAAASLRLCALLRRRHLLRAPEDFRASPEA